MGITVRELFYGGSIVNFPCTNADFYNHATDYDRKYKFINYGGADDYLNGARLGSSMSWKSSGFEKDDNIAAWTENGGLMYFSFYFPNQCSSFTVSGQICPSCNGNVSGAQVGCGRIDIDDFKAFTYRANGSYYYNYPNLDKAPAERRVGSWSAKSWNNFSIVFTNGSTIKFNNNTRCSIETFITKSWLTSQGFTSIKIGFGCGSGNFSGKDGNHQHVGVRNISVSSFGNLYYKFPEPDYHAKNTYKVMDNTNIWQAFEFN